MILGSMEGLCWGMSEGEGEKTHDKSYYTLWTCPEASGGPKSYKPW